MCWALFHIAVRVSIYVYRIAHFQVLRALLALEKRVIKVRERE